jgi:hypothetical protein
MLVRFPARGEAMVAPIQALLRGPRLRDDGRRRAVLPAPQRAPDERSMAIVPGRFDQHAPQMSIPGFGDRAAGLFGAAGMLGRHESDKGHRARGRGEAARIAQFGSNRQRGEIIDPPETPQPFDARL